MTVVKKSMDAVLIERLHQHDEEALSMIYNAHWDMVFLAAYNMIKDKQVCEDIAQEVFISLWQRRSRLMIKVSLKSYLYTSTIYNVYDYFNKNKKIATQTLFENFDTKIQESTPETKLIHQELLQFLDSVIETLPDKCREVYQLSRDEQLSNKAIAERLNISQRTVEGHISKALKILRDALGVAISIEFISLLYS